MHENTFQNVVCTMTAILSLSLNVIIEFLFNHLVVISHTLFQFSVDDQYKSIIFI